MKKYIRTIRAAAEPMIVISTVIALCVANLWHVIIHYFNSPPGTVYVGLAHYHEDYLYYLSQVTQGARGAWLTKNLYTGEVIPQTILWWPNLLLGKIAGIFNLPSWTVYNGALFVVSVFVLLSIYWTAGVLYPKNRRLRIAAFLIAACTSMFYQVVRTPAGGIGFNPYTYFYNYTAALNRLGGVFHLMLQNIITLVLIVTAGKILEGIFSAKVLQSKQLISLTLRLSVLTLILYLINPVYVLVDALSVAVIGLVGIIVKFSVRRLVRLLFVALVTGIPLIVPTVLFDQVFRNEYYAYFRWWESAILPGTFPAVVRSMMMILPLIAVGLVPFLRRGGILRILMLVWVTVPNIIYFSTIPLYIKIPYFRLHQPPAYLVFGAMAAEALNLIPLVLDILRPERFFRLRLPAGALAKAGFSVSLSLYILLQLPAIKTEVDMRSANLALPSWLNHIPKPTYDALLWLRNQPDDKIAVAYNTLELMVPVVSGKTIYTAHKSLSLLYGDKIAKVALFYTRNMTPEEGWQFVSGNNIGYVLWWTTDGDPSLMPSHYPFLQEVHRTETVIIYGVTRH